MQFVVGEHNIWSFELVDIVSVTGTAFRFVRNGGAFQLELCRKRRSVAP
jgi:hypothetical protein